MADIQALLTRKAGPLPVWGWAAVAGGAVSILYLRGKGQSTSPSGGQVTDASTASPFGTPIIVTPSMPNVSASTTSSSPTTGSKLGMITGDPAGVFLNPSTKSNVIAALPKGSSIAVTGAPVPGERWGGIDYWVPVSYGGQQGYVAGALIQLPTGMGGGGTVRTTAGSGRVARFASPHAHPQFVHAGMGGGGPAGLRTVARQTGLPEVRLMALNPGHWRGGSPPDHIYLS